VGAFLEEPMMGMLPLSLLGLLLICIAAPAQSAQPGPLELVASIPMPNVRGRIDHMAFDQKRRRLFVAALGNDTLEVIDVRSGAEPLLRSVTGFGEPQGVLYVHELDRLYVANGRGNRIDVLDGSSLTLRKRLGDAADADNVRYDTAARKAYVGYGRGALRVLDVATDSPVGDIRLAAHPESFQMEQAGSRIFVNVPTAGHVAVIDRTQNKVVATWAVPGASSNFPMALDETSRRLFVGTRRPALMLVYDTNSGNVVARYPIGADTDDIFFDAQRKRVYVICGEGRVDVFRQQSPDSYVLESSIRTVARARTGLFVPGEEMLYVAAPASDGSPARLLAYRTGG
jgi:DNA-binding beta-propeller fold protein YncE